jgi:hypothetical protein
MIRRDYIDRLIEQCAAALSRALDLRRGSQLEPALQVVREAQEQLVGPLRPVLERLEPTSAVEVAGSPQLDRVRVYAALVGEEGLIYESLGQSAQAYLCCRRSMELYAALSLAGAPPDEAGLGRIALLLTVLDVDDLDSRYANEIRRLRTAGGPA